MTPRSPALLTPCRARLEIFWECSACRFRSVRSIPARDMIATRLRIILYLFVVNGDGQMKYLLVSTPSPVQIVWAMLANRTSTVTASWPGQMAGDAPPKRQRARRTNDPFAGLDKLTARGRRTADLVRAYLVALGNPDSIGRQAAAIAAAELQVLAEEARAAALRDGASADLDRVVRMQGAADRALKRLGIKPAAAPKPPTLAEHLARRTTRRKSGDAP
jgi:hypothetical protein